MKIKEITSNNYYETIARGYEGAIYDIVGQFPNGKAKDYNWKLSNIPAIKFKEMTPDEWKQWFKEELEFTPRYEMFKTPSDEELVAVTNGIDYFIWDGYHRIGAAYYYGYENYPLPTILGTQK